MLMPSTPLKDARSTFRSNRSTPWLLNPSRLMIASCSTRRNMRGLALPGCGRGVTVPISRKPKPSAASASMYSPFLSSPAASPTGFGKRIPIPVRDSPRSAPAPRSAAAGPSVASDFSVKSWAASGSRRKSAARAREYSIEELGPCLRRDDSPSRADRPLGESFPLAAGQSFDGPELVLVAHLAALADPVAEVHVLQAAALRFLDLPEDVEGAEARLRDERIEERVHGGQSVGQLVHDRYHAQLPAFAEFDQARGDVRLQQEVRVLLAAVVVHAAAAMALALVEAVERVVLGVELELAVAVLEGRMARDGAALRPGGLEFAHHDAHRDARVAMIAIRAVGEGTTAAKAGRHQRAVRVRVDQVAGRRDLRTSELPRQVAAGIRRRRIELKVRDRQVVELRH